MSVPNLGTAEQFDVSVQMEPKSLHAIGSIASRAVATFNTPGILRLSHHRYTQDDPLVLPVEALDIVETYAGSEFSELAVPRRIIAVYGADLYRMDKTDRPTALVKGAKLDLHEITAVNLETGHTAVTAVVEHEDEALRSFYGFTMHPKLGGSQLTTLIRDTVPGGEHPDPEGTFAVLLYKALADKSAA